MRITLPLLAVLATLAPARAQEEPKEFEVKPEPFRLVIRTEGWFLPVEAAPLRVDPQEWKALTIKQLAPHGTSLKTGAEVVSFEVDDLVERIAAFERGRETGSVGLRRAELELAALRQTTPLDLDAARRAAENTKLNLDMWNKIWRPLEVEEAKRDLQTSEQNLFYAQEELRQLEKMYKADDLTEETEEVILKRSKWAVEKAEFALKRAKELNKDSLEIRIPRIDIERKEAADRARIAREKAEKDCQAALKQKELEVAERQRLFDEDAKKLEKLKADLTLLRALKAPKDGWLLWGDWTLADGPGKQAEFERKLANAPRACITPKDVFATLASGGPPKQIATRIAQGQRTAIGWRGLDPEKIGQAQRFATIDAAPDAAMPVALASIDLAPDSQGRYLVKLACDPEAYADDSLPPIIPGMKVWVTLLDYRKADALSVPHSFIDREFDAQEGGRYFVYVKGEGGKTEKRAVRLGHRNEKRAEIADGLKPGEKLAPVP